MKTYLLNLNAQINGDHEIHEVNCIWKPTSNFEDLGHHSTCADAVKKAILRHPLKKINGCKYCSKECHTS